MFAGGGLNAPAHDPGSSGSFEALPAPQILTPDVVLTRDPTMDLTLIRPDGLDSAKNYTVRVTVNGRNALERPLPAQEQFVMAGVTLTEGENSIRAALLDEGAIGATSAALIVTRDTTAPVIRVTRPEPGSPVYGDHETLRGRTEAGATIDVTDVATEETIAASVDAEGRFTADLTLALGDNEWLLSSRDPAGNVASTHVTINRADTLAALTLTISEDTLKATDLPQTLIATAFIQDERGQPVDGAQVTFSLSPPNATTLTYRTLAVAGQATWPDVDIAIADDPHGSWLVTVLVELPSGVELRANKSITVR
ncbi:MAG: Ig-like domain-containing protein [Chloroflexota bacterium]